MIKTVLAGLWACVLLVGAAYGTVTWRAQQAAKAANASSSESIEKIKTKMISVPMLADGGVKGYVVAQFTFTINSADYARLSVKPDIYLQDEAFRAIFAGEKVDFRNMRKSDLKAFELELLTQVNKHLPGPYVREIFINDLNFVSREQTRRGSRE